MLWTRSLRPSATGAADHRGAQNAHHARPALTTQEAAEQIAGYLQCVGTGALATALRDGVDLNRLIRAELAARGVDLAGRWVGFPAAKSLHGV